MVIILFLKGTKLKPKDLTTCPGLWPNTMTDEIKTLMMHNSPLDDIFELNFPVTLPEPGTFPRVDHRVQCSCGHLNGLPGAEKPAQTKTSMGLQNVTAPLGSGGGVGVMGVSVPSWVCVRNLKS